MIERKAEMKPEEENQTLKENYRVSRTPPNNKSNNSDGIYL